MKRARSDSSGLLFEQFGLGLCPKGSEFVWSFVRSRLTWETAATTGMIVSQYFYFQQKLDDLLDQDFFFHFGMLTRVQFAMHAKWIPTHAETNLSLESSSYQGIPVLKTRWKIRAPVLADKSPTVPIHLSFFQAILRPSSWSNQHKAESHFGHPETILRASSHHALGQVGTESDQNSQSESRIE